MKEKINLTTVPFDMEMAKKITKGKIPGEIQIVSSFWTKSCRILCFDMKGSLHLGCQIITKKKF